MALRLEDRADVFPIADLTLGRLGWFFGQRRNLPDDRHEDDCNDGDAATEDNWTVAMSSDIRWRQLHDDDRLAFGSAGALSDCTSIVTCPSADALCAVTDPKHETDQNTRWASGGDGGGLASKRSQPARFPLIARAPEPVLELTPILANGRAPDKQIPLLRRGSAREAASGPNRPRHCRSLQFEWRTNRSSRPMALYRHQPEPPAKGGLAFGAKLAGQSTSGRRSLRLAPRAGVARSGRFDYWNGSPSSLPAG